MSNVQHGRIKPVLYLSGPMTGIKNKNKTAFTKETKRLRRAGYTVVNPWELDIANPQPSWEDCLRRDIIELMTCDGVAVLPGWQNSRGARLETDIARQLGWMIRSVDDWIRRA